MIPHKVFKALGSIYAPITITEHIRANETKILPHNNQVIIQ